MTVVIVIVALFFLIATFVNTHEVTKGLKGVDKYISYGKNIIWRLITALIAFLIISNYLDKINLTSEIIKTTENTPTFFRSIFDNLGNLFVIGTVFWIWNAINEVESIVANEKEGKRKKNE